MFLFVQQDDETKPSVVKKEEPDAAKPKQEPMEAEPAIKTEVKTEPKEEEEGGANSTSTSQNHKKSKPNLSPTFSFENNLPIRTLCF